MADAWTLEVLLVKVKLSMEGWTNLLEGISWLVQCLLTFKAVWADILSVHYFLQEHPSQEGKVEGGEVLWK